MKQTNILVDYRIGIFIRIIFNKQYTEIEKKVSLFDLCLSFLFISFHFKSIMLEIHPLIEISPGHSY
jgi:hypothetical protein